MGKIIYAPVAMLSFPVLVEPRPQLDDNDKPIPGSEQYSVQLVWKPVNGKPVNLDVLKAAIVETATEKWGAEKAVKGLKSGALTSPLRTDKLEDKGLPDGTVYMNVRTKNRPQGVYLHPDMAAVVPEGKKRPPAKVAPEDMKETFYPGSMAYVSLSPFAYDRKGKKGVSFGLQHLQLIDGTTPRIDGRKSAEDTFEADATATPPDLSDL